MPAARGTTAQPYLEPLQAVFDEWRQLASVPGESTIYTDYYVIRK